MSDLVQDEFERHKHLEEEPEDHHGRQAALLIGVLAAVLAVCEMAERSSQNSYISHHIAASNEYAFYQARQTRALVLNQSATTVSALSQSPEAAKAAADARAEATRLTADSARGNGQAQILARATKEGEAREVALHRYEWFELVTSALQISIVLASVSVITKVRPIAFIGAGIGLIAALVALLVATGIV